VIQTWFFYNSESWDDHIIVTWDYEGEDVIYLSNKEKKEYHKREQIY
jgi:hypothetical protein